MEIAKLRIQKGTVLVRRQVQKSSLLLFIPEEVRTDNHIGVITQMAEGDPMDQFKIGDAILFYTHESHIVDPDNLDDVIVPFSDIVAVVEDRADA